MEACLQQGKNTLASKTRPRLRAHVARDKAMAHGFQWQRQGLILIFGVLFLKKNSLSERLMAVSSTALKISATSSLASSNSTNQSLLIWAELRKDILAQVWSANRDIIRSMAAVIMRVQDVQWKNRKLETLKPAIEEYRRVVHASLDLLSPKAVDLCQRFLMTAYEIFEAKRLPEDGNPLKAIRYEFTIESWSRSILHMSKGNQLLLNWPLETGSDCMDFNLPLAFLCKNP